MAECLFDDHDGMALAELVRNKEVTPAELLDEAISRVETADAKLGFMADRYYDFARDQIARGLPDGPFTGVPFLLKDMEAEVEGLSSTAGARLLKGFKALHTRVLAQRYLDAPTLDRSDSGFEL